jgi:hypothetical protein
MIDFQIPAEGVEGHVAGLDVKEVVNEQQLKQDEVQEAKNEDSVEDVEDSSSCTP